MAYASQINPISAIVSPEEKQAPAQRFLNNAQAAKYLGLSPNTLRSWRYMNVGPKFSKPRGRAMYDIADLDDYVNSGRRVPSVRSTRKDRQNVAV